MTRYDTRKIQERMLRRGWPVVRLAARSGVPESTIRRVFQAGRAHPDTLKKLARALNVRFADLVLLDQEKPA